MKITQIVLYETYYHAMFKRFSRFPKDIDLVIISFIMDLHYYDAKQNVYEELKKLKIVYINYLVQQQGRFLHLYPKPTWINSNAIQSLSRFLRSMMWEVHGLSNAKFYKVDLDLISTVFDHTHYITVDIFHILFDMKDGRKIIFYYDAYGVRVLTLGNKIKFFPMYQ